MILHRSRNRVNVHKLCGTKVYYDFAFVGSSWPLGLSFQVKRVSLLVLLQLLELQALFHLSLLFMFLSKDFYFSFV